MNPLRAFLSPFNLIAALLLGLAYGAFTLVNQPAALPDIQGLDDGGKRQNLTVELFFSNTQLSKYVVERRTLSLREAERLNLPQTVVEALLEGPRTQGLRLLGKKGDIPTVFVRSGYFFVDLPSSWKTLNYSGSGELVLLCSLTRTLMGLGEYKGVNFTVGGQATESLMGHVDLTAPFTGDTCSL
jgi:hypothetical protein